MPRAFQASVIEEYLRTSFVWILVTSIVLPLCLTEPSLAIVKPLIVLTSPFVQWWEREDSLFF